MLAVPPCLCRAVPIDVGQTLTEQRFEWQRAYSSRSAGTYGQYEVALQAGTEYELFTSSPHGGNTTDSYLYLLDAAFRVVAADDDSNGNLQARITYTPPTSGTYYLRLRAYDRGRYGFCSLSVVGTAPAPPPLVLVIRPGDTLHDQYFGWESAYSSRPAGEYASYSLEATAGETYTLTTSNARGGNTTDTYLYLFNSAGSSVAEDDDSNGDLASRIVYQAPSSGAYTVKLRAYDRGAYGYCTLAVTSTAQGAGNPLYPDLITWREKLEDVEIVDSGGTKLLRFSNAAANIGQGDLMLYGVVQPDGTTFAYQRVWNDNGTYTDHLAGTFLFAGHEDHNHWHFDDFADYNLRALAPDGSPGQIVATSQKVSFCLMDSVAYDLSLPSARLTAYHTCDRQGISIGWADLYARNLAGQNINLTAVADGVYWLESVADPNNRLLEMDDGNNVARLKIQIDQAGNTVAILE